jgi:hypothetical protein
MARKKSSNAITGRWRIVLMSAWEDDYLDEEVEAFIEFKDKGGGSFHFGYIQGMIDWRETKRGEATGVEWTWEGGDAADGSLLTGRGRAVLQDDELRGEFFIHDGEESEMVAKRA